MIEWGLNQLPHLPALVHLDLQCTPIETMGHANILPPGLTYLNLSLTRIGFDELPSLLWQVPQLQELHYDNIAQADLDTVLDIDLSHLTSLTTLYCDRRPIRLPPSLPHTIVELTEPDRFGGDPVG